MTSPIWGGLSIRQSPPSSNVIDRRNLFAPQTPPSTPRTDAVFYDQERALAPGINGIANQLFAEDDMRRAIRGQVARDTSPMPLGLDDTLGDEALRNYVARVLAGDDETAAAMSFLFGGAR